MENIKEYRDLLFEKIKTATEKLEESKLDVLYSELLFEYGAECLIEKFIDLLLPKYQTINKNIKRETLTELLETAALKLAGSKNMMPTFKHMECMATSVGCSRKHDQ